MAKKWEVTKAVRESDLPGIARTIVFVLADAADVNTAEVPERFTPTLDELAKQCGFGRSTVAEHLNLLVLKRWVVRSLWPSGRNRYRLLAPWIAEELAAITEGQDQGQSSSWTSDLVDESRSWTVDVVDQSSSRTIDMVDESGSRTADQVDQSSSWMVDSPAPGLPYKEARSLPDQEQEEPSSSGASTPEPAAPSTAKRPRKPEALREDVERICRHMIDRLKANDFKAPKSIPDAWRREARLLLDDDHRTEEQVHRAIDWATRDTFWKGNIRSVPKLRAQYDTLRSHAERERAVQARASPAERPSTTDARVNTAVTTGAAMKARREAQALQQQQGPKEIGR